MNALRFFGLLLALPLLSLFAAPSQACEFCGGEKGETLIQKIESAQMVIYGHFENPRPGGELGQGVADFVFEDVLKSHDAIKGDTKITLPNRAGNRAQINKTKFLVFCDVFKGKINAYHGIAVTDDGEMRKYIAAVLKNKGKSQAERLRVAFDYLNSPESDVAIDAYQEFLRSDYSDYKQMAKTLPADKIAGWLQDPKTSQYRYGLYASLLGHCGKEKHAEILFSMMNDPEVKKGSGLHGLMAGYMMLEPKRGWKYLTEVVKDKDEKFFARYSALRTMRFLWENRPDLLGKDETASRAEIVKGVAGVLEMNDMADFVVEDLRKWHRWEYCDQVLDLYGKKDFNISAVRRAILRYALQCPSGRAQDFVKTERARDAEWVADTLELLNLETTPAPPAKSASKDEGSKKSPLTK